MADSRFLNASERKVLIETSLQKFGESEEKKVVFKVFTSYGEIGEAYRELKLAYRELKKKSIQAKKVLVITAAVIGYLDIIGDWLVFRSFYEKEMYTLAWMCLGSILAPAALLALAATFVTLFGMCDAPLGAAAGASGRADEPNDIPLARDGGRPAGGRASDIPSPNAPTKQSHR